MDRNECKLWKLYKNCPTCLYFQQTQPKEKLINHDIPGKQWEVIGADMFNLYNRKYLFIAHYHSKFPVIRKTDDHSTDSLIPACKIIFSEYGLPKKIMSDAGCNFISDKFKRFCKNLNTEQAVSSLYHHHINGQGEASIKFIKHTIKNALILNQIYIYL